MKFEGFDYPNTTPVPDIVFDELLSELTGNELKVLLYIIRRTYGFGKNADAISLSQFKKGITTQEGKVLDKGCGIEHNRTILAALASLEKKGYVVKKKRQTHAGDSDATIYRLRFKNAPEAQRDDKVVTSGNHVVTPSNDGSYPTSPRWLPQVTTVVTSGNPQETVIQQTDSQETVIQESTNADASHARAELIEDIAEVLPEVQANVIRLEAQLPSKESEEIHALPAHGAVPRDVPGPRVSVAAAAQDQARVAGPTTTTTPPSADGGATGLSEVDTSHRASLRSGAVGPATPQGSGPRRSGKGKAVPQDVTQAELPPAPKFHLTEQEEAFWDLWCGIWFNKDIPPELTETAYKHVQKLAPHVKTMEQLESLTAYARKELEASQGLKNKRVQLGNCVKSYPGWKQEQQKPKAPSKPKEAAPVENKPLPVLAPVRGERRR